MLFGNWTVNDEGIAWNSAGLNHFVIPRDDLVKTKQLGDDEPVLYEWILTATEEAWLTQNDLYDLNYAFVFAVAKFGADFNYEIFDATLAEQYEQFEMEDEEDSEF